jgi:hypothetical protein
MGRLLRTITSETQALTRHVTPVEGIVEGPPLEPTWLDDMVSHLTWYRLKIRTNSSGSLDWMIRMDGIRLSMISSGELLAPRLTGTDEIGRVWAGSTRTPEARIFRHQRRIHGGVEIRRR